MTRPRVRPPALPTADPQRAHPNAYQRGVDIANRTIDMRVPMFVTHALTMAEDQLENWPVLQGKHSLTEQQYATAKGFAITLREYREAQADV